MDLLVDYREQADLILTSPPYDSLREYGGHAFDFPAVAAAISQALKPGGVAVWVVADSIVDGSQTGTSLRHALAFMELGLNLHETMIFEKQGARPRGSRRYCGGWEYMFVLSNGEPKTFNPLEDRVNRQAGRPQYRKRTRRLHNGELKPEPDGSVVSVTPDTGLRTTVWEYAVGHNLDNNGFKRAYDHPAIFPYRLALDHIRTWTEEGDLVIDPMCGSGTVIEAAQYLKRRAVGIDIHPDYTAISRERLAQSLMV